MKYDYFASLFKCLTLLGLALGLITISFSFFLGPPVACISKNHMKKVTVSIVIVITTMILLPQLTMFGRNICITNNIIAIANGINLFILTFEKTYFLPKNDTPKVKANNTMNYNIHLKKFNINILLS